MSATRKSHKKVIIIGAGSAGLSAQKIVHEKTRNYLLIDKGPLGTTCARVGCMPSKSLIEAAKLFNYADKIAKIPIRIPQPQRRQYSIKVFRHVRKLTRYFVDGVIKGIKEIPKKNFLLGEAVFLDKKNLKVGNRIFTADYFIIATGSRPFIPLQFQDLRSSLLSSEDIFKLKEAPKTLAVVGSGAIGLELAMALRDLGTQVTVFGAHRSLGGLSDPDLKEKASKVLDQKIRLLHEDVREIKKSKTTERFLLKSDNHSLSFDQVLIATGREPNLALLNELNLKKDESGHIVFDKETGHIPGTCFYIAGDAKDERPILHEANFDGVLAGLNATRSHDQHIRRYVPMRITFTTPQIAVVGLSHKDLLLTKTQFKVSEVSFENQGRSRTQFQNEGHLKLYIHPAKKTLLGAELFTHAAEHMAHFLALAMTHQLSLEEILASPIYHPVVEEGLRTALKRGLR